MVYLTLSGRLSTDPLFDPRSLRPGYYDWHELPVDFEDCEPSPGAAVAVSYRVHVAYTDAGDRRIARVEALLHRTADEYRRGVPAKARALDPFAPLDRALISLFMADAASPASQQAVEDEVQRHQADRDDELADRMGALS